ncbi:uncharacterized protein LOC116843798 isoform X1 [Odontomachus brunneus]|uniref:uncharacterized protein LOC116843798 isoform X1 n=1 Tax=Odontomachus brunneus TaxID=486640 RepID=UPI0013F201F8|nr:uncharacterized protein LOC116843798 isoform X1 [Odontomachus brunneus]
MIINNTRGAHRGRNTRCDFWQNRKRFHRTRIKRFTKMKYAHIKEFATGVRNVVEDLTLEDATSKDYSVWVEQSQVEAQFFTTDRTPLNEIRPLNFAKHIAKSFM